jgi:hypothetical protein
VTDPTVEPGIPTDDGTYRYGELDRLEADLAVIEVAMEHVDAGDLDAYDRLVGELEGEPDGDVGSA